MHYVAEEHNNLEIDSPRNSFEAIRPTTNISSVRNVVENLGVCIEDWVDEANGSLASSCTVLVQLFEVSAKVPSILLYQCSVFGDILTKVSTEANSGEERLEP